MLFKYDLKTDKNGFYNVSDKVRESIEKSKVTEGICVVYCPHTTAGITINENADEYVARDVNLALEAVFPKMEEFLHDEGNSNCHVKSSVIGASQTLIISQGKPVFGVWQDVYFTEFDAPRTRNFYVKIIKG